MQKKRSGDALHNILSSFRQFERKLDKLQDEVSFHGQTLTDLRVMLANLSGSTLYDAKGDFSKSVNKTTAVDSLINGTVKTKRKVTVQHVVPSKVVTKSYNQAKKYGIHPIKEPSHSVKKLASSPKGALGIKRVMRPRKGEAPRKATTLRPKKITIKKSNSPLRTFEDPSEFKSPLII